MKLPKRHSKCKTCGNVFRYESSNERHCPSCRQATATGLRSLLPSLIENQEGICPLCNKPLPEISAKIHVDHRWPKAFGGTDDFDNLQAVHTPCNRYKNASIAFEGCKIVKEILHVVVNASRVSSRGSNNDCRIILDGNNGELICRLWVNRTQVYLGVFDENKKETRNRIGSFDDIYRFAEEIMSTTQRYLSDEQSSSGRRSTP